MNTIQKRFSALRRLLFWLLLLLTLWFSLIPGNQVPSQLHFWDKAQHALGFAGLAFLGLRAYPDRIRQLMFGLMLLGAGIECAQALTGWRQGDWADWLADCVGLLMGYGAWQAATRTFRSRV
jgi:VanZ family protein